MSKSQWGSSADHGRREYVHSLLKKSDGKMNKRAREQVAQKFNCALQTVYTDILYFRASYDDKSFLRLLRKKFSSLKIRARRYGVKDTLTFEEIVSAAMSPDAVCYHCKRQRRRQYLCFDHLVAMCNGGSNSIDNLVLSCFQCNTSKGARDYWQGR